MVFYTVPLTHTHTISNFLLKLMDTTATKLVDNTAAWASTLEGAAQDLQWTVLECMCEQVMGESDIGWMACFFVDRF